ncbi:hypothetical protein BGX28_009974 [Mortierella sp. GBA30]|nr:hypothetical protein BGX28_009974 [Mortierella sp. GBA30]
MEAHVMLNAYDRVLYDQTVDLTKTAPLLPRSFSAPALLPAQLPRQLFSLPAVEALAMIQLYDSKGTPILCTSVPLTNAVTVQSPLITIASVSVTAATVALTIITGVLAAFSSAATLTSIPLSALPGVGTKGGGGAVAAAAPRTITGSSGGPTPSAWDVVSFCQFVTMSGSLNLEYPALLQQWTQNFGWSMGLVQVESWNRAIDGLRSRISNSLSPSPSSDNEETTNEAVTGKNESLQVTGNTINKVNTTHVINNSNSSNTNNNNNNSTQKFVRAMSMHRLIDNAGHSRALENDNPVLNQAESKFDALPLSSVETKKEVRLNSKRQVVPAMTPKVDNQPLPFAALPFEAKAPAFAPAPVPGSLTQQQAPLPAPQSASPVTQAPPPSLPPSQPGTQLLPSVKDNSLMNRQSDFSTLKSLGSPSNTTVGYSPSENGSIPSPIPSQHVTPSLWPLDGFNPSTNALDSSSGMESFGERLHIPANNMFMTSLFFFLILLLTTSLVAMLLRACLEVYAHFHPGKFTKLRRRFSSYYLGQMLRVVLLGFLAVTTLAFYQITLGDTWIITSLAVLTLLIFLGLISFMIVRLWRADGVSLFFDERLKSKYGALYDQYLLSTYWFFIPVFVYQISKAAIVGLGQGSVPFSNLRTNRDRDHHGSSEAWAQTSLLLLAELLFTALTIWKKPFAERTPNRLNGVLGSIRVLNVIMLAVLIESTSISAVSRTVIGVIIMVTQAMMMIVLGGLVFYQLGRVLWQIGLALKAKKKKKGLSKGVKRTHRGVLSEEKEDEEEQEMMVVSVKDDQKHDRDAEDDKEVEDERPGRMASEHVRSGGGGDESMTSVVGMMGIGSNPTIRCTPASDDETSDDDDAYRDSEGAFKITEAVGGHQNHKQQSDRGESPVSQTQDEETKGAVGIGEGGEEGAQASNRDSTNSHESSSSHILDYYSPVYLPSSVRSIIQKKKATHPTYHPCQVSGPFLCYGSISNSSGVDDLSPMASLVRISIL